MDYEKAYKAVLKTATQWIKDGCTDKERICLESVFPELRESEDERIRKELVNFILYKAGHLLDEETEHKFAAYLEKQKEPHYTKRNALFDKCVANCDPEIMKKVSDEIDSQLKKERKPVEPSDEELQRHQDELYDFKVFAARQAREHHISFVHDFEWNNFCAELLSYFNEQKPAEWSEEDEKIRRNLMSLLANMRGDRITEETYQKYYSWLKFLRPSKDCSDCAKHLEGYISGRCDAENKLLEQFGALVTPEGELHIKPRWKPSEEQMRYLLAVINDPNNAGAESCHLILESLYNDLKKLM